MLFNEFVINAFTHHIIMECLSLFCFYDFMILPFYVFQTRQMFLSVTMPYFCDIDMWCLCNQLFIKKISVHHTIANSKMVSRGVLFISNKNKSLIIPLIIVVHLFHFKKYYTFFVDQYGTWD